MNLDVYEITEECLPHFCNGDVVITGAAGEFAGVGFYILDNGESLDLVRVDTGSEQNTVVVSKLNSNAGTLLDNKVYDTMLIEKFNNLVKCKVIWVCTRMDKALPEYKNAALELLTVGRDTLQDMKKLGL